MPISKRQFELGIDEDIQVWMRKVYEMLSHDRESAYSYEELVDSFLGDTFSSRQRDYFRRALEVLVEVGAVVMRWVTDTDYYAFRREVNAESWVDAII